MIILCVYVCECESEREREREGKVYEMVHYVSKVFLVHLNVCQHEGQKSYVQKKKKTIYPLNMCNEVFLS